LSRINNKATRAVIVEAAAAGSREVTMAAAVETGDVVAEVKDEDEVAVGAHERAARVRIYHERTKNMWRGQS
jgi:hypothetical protein